MLRNYLLVITTTACSLLFTLGIYMLTKEIEPNNCEMTYMFETPKYTKIPMKDKFFDYGLYYYDEGRIKPDLKNLKGAPVLFVPGNGGSLKQVRSLGSVALRQAMGHNKPHLDYFTINYNEELSAIYGGFLTRQKQFLKLAIKTILRLYSKQDENVERKIVIVGHSMGGVVAKSILNEANWLQKVAVCIFISSPLDRPVVYADKELFYFYHETNQLLYKRQRAMEKNLEVAKKGTKVPGVLLISIGGGSRDLLVPAPLTESEISDVHAISTEIPKVWLTCDHLSAVWCLQLMKVINKFLFEISFKTKNGFTLFGLNDELNLQAAQRHFIGYQQINGVQEKKKDIQVEKWNAVETLNISKIFKKGLPKAYEQAINFENVSPYEYIYVSVTHEIGNQWLFGCDHENCLENPLLTQQIKQLPSKRGPKSYVLLNLAAVFNTFANWTHLLVHLPATQKYAALYIDVHNAEERLVNFQAPQWFQFLPTNLSTTKPSTMFRKLKIEGLTESFYAFKLNFKATKCESNNGNYELIVKIYEPMAPGFDRYYTLTKNTELSIKLPKSYLQISEDAMPTTLYVDTHIDPWCVIDVSYQFSLTDTMRNMVQQYYYYIPTHMVVIAISTLGSMYKHSMMNTEKFSFLQLKSFCLPIGVRLAANVITSMPFIPHGLRLEVNQSIYATLIIHGFAMACCVVIACFIRLNIKFFIKIAKMINPTEETIAKVIRTSRVTTGLLTAIFSKGISLATAFVVSMGVMAFLIEHKNKEKADNDATVTTDNAEEIAEDSNSNENLVQIKRSNYLNFHVAIMLLNLLLISVNIGDTLDWVNCIMNGFSYSTYFSFQSFLLAPATFVLVCLPFLWHLDVPSYADEGAKRFSMILNIIAVICLPLCAEKVYNLNYVISVVIGALVIREGHF